MKIVKNSQYLDGYIFGMSNLYPSKTGLPVCVWVDTVGSERNVPHNIPRIKVQNTKGNRVDKDQYFVMSISQDPEVLAGECELQSKDRKQIEDWIKKYEDVLIKHWYQLIDDDDLREIVYTKKDTTSK